MSKTGRLMFAASETCADLLYETGFSAPDPFLWFSVGADGFMVVSPMELERARKQSRCGIKIMTMRQAAEFWKLDMERPDLEDLIAAVSAAEDISEWNVNGSFPFSLAEKLCGKSFSLKIRKFFLI